MIVLRCAIIHDEALILDPDLAVLAIRAYPIASQDSLAESRRLKWDRPPISRLSAGEMLTLDAASISTSHMS